MPRQTPEPKFKVGDKVRVFPKFHWLYDREFVITGFGSHGRREYTRYYYMYEGEFKGGVWEVDLELVHAVPPLVDSPYRKMPL